MSIFERLLKSFDILWQELSRLPGRVLRGIRGIILTIAGRNPQGGFVLPTVTMVILVVVLTSATLVLRSMDRAKNASNFRVSQVALNAAAPALDRAKAKIENLFADPSLPRGTPSDSALSGVFERRKYTLEDEVRLEVAFNIDGQGALENDEKVRTAWRFPVDTDNNGKFDSFTLYGVYYQSTDDRGRVPFEARTRPQVLNATQSNPACPDAEGTVAGLVGSDGWYNQDGVLKKAFFTYVTNVPITNINEAGLLQGYDAAPYNSVANYENFKGNQGFTALEYQQDRARIPLGNNAIVTEDDLDFTSGTNFRLSGRIVTNSNFIVSEANNVELRFYQVSSPKSCFYEEDNAKIVVAGNVGMGLIHNNGNNTREVDVDLFRGVGNGVGNAKINTVNRSANNPSSDLAFNTKAYEERIARLVQLTLASQGVAQDPVAVRTRIEERVSDNPELDSERDRLRTEELEIWFRNRTRKVPASEVPFNSSQVVAVGTVGWPLPGAGTDNLRPPDAWILPTDANTKLTLNRDRLPQANPETVENEPLLGDRILVGNNLPSVWWNNIAATFSGDKTENTDGLNSEYWYKANGTKDPAEGARYRLTRARRLDDVGLVSRDGFWERMSAKIPEKKNEAVGGLRIVTGAGIYLPAEINGGNTNPTGRVGRNSAEFVVWPDWMPQPPDPTIAYITTEPPGSTNNLLYLNQHPYRSIDVIPGPGNTAIPRLDSNGQPLKRGIIERYQDGKPVYIDDESVTGVDAPRRPFLKMRASAVYHYRYEEGKKPIACVSSFYDPTNWKTARNRPGLPNVSSQVANGELPGSGLTNNADHGFSNNGVVYAVNDTALATVAADNRVIYQSNMVYPNGRLVNPLLKKALEKVRTDSANDLTLAERGALDSTWCGIKILEGTLQPNNEPRSGFRLAHGTIQEVAFLDGRQIKSTERAKSPVDNATTVYNSQPLSAGQNATRTGASQYDLQLEHRLPMEIRATVIDMFKLREEPANPNTVPNVTGNDAMPNPEYMFPVSGIIYATRDDGLEDASNRPGRTAGTDPALALLNNEPFMQKPADKVSASDYWLDPTRRPNGIVITNAKRLNRNDNNVFQEAEKGLTLVSNLPVYLQAEKTNGPNDGTLPGFNIHDNEEFMQALQPEWENFYTRTNLNPNFACRKNDSRLPSCTNGDKWRAANILSDATTLLSDKFRFGFRNEGDYDIRNNQTDNLFRDPEISTPNGAGGKSTIDALMTATVYAADPLGAGNRNLMQPPSNALLLPATNAMKLDYAITALNNYPDLRSLRESTGFLTDNSFAVNGLSSKSPVTNEAFVTAGRNLEDRNYSAKETGATRSIASLSSTYFNNFTTPVQRRVSQAIPVALANLPIEYLMETCLKLPVSQCKAEDWYAYQDSSGNLVPASDILDLASPLILVSDLSNTNNILRTAQAYAGTTAIAPSAKWQHYPRRVAFLRKTDRIENLNAVDPAIADPPTLERKSSVGFRFLTSSNGTVYNAPLRGDLMLDIESNPAPPARNFEIKMPVPIAMNSSDRPVCYHYNALFNNAQEALPNPREISFHYLDGTTTTKIVCPRFDDIRTSLINRQRDNVLWYASAANVDSPIIDTGNKTSYSRSERPLGLRGNTNNINYASGERPYASGERQIQHYREMYNRNVNTVLYNSPAEAYVANPDLTKSQPPLLPVLQISSVDDVRTPDENPNGGQPYQATAWLPQVGNYPNNIHFNMVLASGDTPVRLEEGGGGISNIPRLLENWTPGAVANMQRTEIKGSLIQLQRSIYATAPFHPLYKNGTDGVFEEQDRSVFLNRQRYPTGNGRFAYYEPSGRQWGFDVGMLSQLPDLFSQQFSLPPTDDPNEYFREVSRNDDWVRTLLCAKQIRPDPNNTSQFINTNQRAVNSNQRPETFCTARYP